MEFKPEYCPIKGDARYTIEIDGESHLIQITQEAFEDRFGITDGAKKKDLKETLTEDQYELLERVVTKLVANRSITQMIDKSGLPYNVILVKTKYFRIAQ